MADKDLNDPSLWRTAVDPASGKTYWYHKKTRVSTWDMPSCLKPPLPSSSSISTSNSNAQAQHQQQMQLLQQQQQQQHLLLQQQQQRQKQVNAQSDDFGIAGSGIASRNPTKISSDSTSADAKQSSQSSYVSNNTNRVPLPVKSTSAIPNQQSNTQAQGQRVSNSTSSFAAELPSSSRAKANRSKIDTIIETLMVGSQFDSYMSCIELSKLLVPSKIELITLESADLIITALVGFVIRSASASSVDTSSSAAFKASAEANAILFNHKILAFQCLFAMTTNPSLVNAFATNQSWMHLFTYIDSTSSKNKCANKECRLLLCAMVSFLICSPVVGVLDDGKVDHYLTSWLSSMCSELVQQPSPSTASAASSGSSHSGGANSSDILSEVSFDAIFSKSLPDFPSLLDSNVVSCFTEIGLRGHVLSVYVTVAVIASSVKLGARYWDRIDDVAITCILRLLSGSLVPAEAKSIARSLSLLVLEAVPASRQVLLDAYANIATDMLLLSQRTYKVDLDEDEFSKNDPRVIFGLNRKVDDLGIEDFDNNADDNVDIEENPDEIFGPIGERLERFILKDVEWRPHSGASWQLTSSLLWVRCPGLRESISDFWDSNAAARGENGEGGGNGLFLQPGCSSWCLDVVTSYLHSGLVVRPLKNPKIDQDDDMISESSGSSSRFLFYRCLEIAKVANELGLDALLNSVITVIADCVRNDATDPDGLRNMVLEFSRNFEIVKLEELISDDSSFDVSDERRSNYRGFNILPIRSPSQLLNSTAVQSSTSSQSQLSRNAYRNNVVTFDLDVGNQNPFDINFDAANVLSDAKDELAEGFDEKMSLTDAVMASLQDVSNILNVKIKSSSSVSSAATQLNRHNGDQYIQTNTNLNQNSDMNPDKSNPSSDRRPSSSPSVSSQLSSQSASSSTYSSASNGPIKNKSGGIYALLLDNMDDDTDHAFTSSNRTANSTKRSEKQLPVSQSSKLKQQKPTGAKTNKSADQTSGLAEYSNSMSLIPPKQPVLSEREKRLQDIAKPKSLQQEERERMKKIEKGQKGQASGNNDRNDYDDEFNYSGINNVYKRDNYEDEDNEYRYENDGDEFRASDDSGRFIEGDFANDNSDQLDYNDGDDVIPSSIPRNRAAEAVDKNNIRSKVSKGVEKPVRLPYSQLPNRTKTFIDWFTDKLRVTLAVAQSYVECLELNDIKGIAELNRALQSQPQLLLELGQPFNERVSGSVRDALGLSAKVQASSSSTSTTTASASTETTRRTSGVSSKPQMSDDSSTGEFNSDSNKNSISSNLNARAPSVDEPQPSQGPSAASGSGVRSSLALLKSKAKAKKVDTPAATNLPSSSSNTAINVPLPNNSSSSNFQSNSSRDAQIDARFNAPQNISAVRNSYDDNSNVHRQTFEKFNRDPGRRDNDEYNDSRSEDSANDEYDNNYNNDDNENDNYYNEDNDGNEDGDRSDNGYDENDEGGGDEAFLAPDGSSLTNITLSPCPHCTRNFAEASLGKHMKICEKVFLRKRKVFDSSKMRINAVPELAELNKNMNKSKKNARGSKAAAASATGGGGSQSQKDKAALWKIQSEQFRAAMRAARDIEPAPSSSLSSSSFGGGGGGASSTFEASNVQRAPAPTAFIDPSLVLCNNCGRRFNQKAADRHIPLCKSIQNKPKSLKKGSGTEKLYAADRIAAAQLTSGNAFSSSNLGSSGMNGSKSSTFRR